VVVAGATGGGQSGARADAGGSVADVLTAEEAQTVKAIKSWKPGEWNWVTVSVRDGKVLLMLNDFPAARVQLAAAAAEAPPGQLALELAPTGAGPGQLELRRLEVMSAPIAPPVPGYPVGWCIRANGSAPEEADLAGFEYVELALQDVNDLSDEDFDKLASRLQKLAAAGLPRWPVTTSSQ
jgi:hypothetical protein